MKLKGSTKLTLKSFGLISGILFALLFVLRVYQTFALTDPETGFFTVHNNITVPLFYVLSIGSVLGVLILAFLTPAGDTGLAEKRNIPHALTSLIFAVALVIQGLNRSVSVSDDPANNATLFTKLAPVFALISAAVMLVNFISFISGKMIVGKIKLLSLVPALWGLFVSVGYFSITASYIKVSQLMLTIFADIFLMLFLFEYARFVSGIGFKDASWTLYGTGTIASALLLITEIPNLIFKYFLQDKLIVNCNFSLCNLAAALFVITALIVAAKNTKKAEE